MAGSEVTGGFVRVAVPLSAVLETWGGRIVDLARRDWRRSMGRAFVLAVTVALLGTSGMDNVLTRTDVLFAGWILIAAGTLWGAGERGRPNDDAPLGTTAHRSAVTTAERAGAPLRATGTEG